MPALKPSEFSATITWLGRVADREAELQSAPVQALDLGFEGPVGEAHGGRTRPSCSRVLDQHPRGTEIANVRPPSSRLQGPDGTTLVIDMENRPCNLPARVIEGLLPGAGKRFKTAAKGRRGVTAWVERPGLLRLGDVVRLHIPDQRPWRHLEAARG